MRPVGFVVAGGRSRRMGRDKALLPWRSGTLLDHAVTRLRAACDEVVLLTGDATRYAELGLPVVHDAWPDAGPLGGLLAGLERLGPTRAGLFLAVDVPHAGVDLLSFLAEAGEGWDAAVPVLEAGPEPLCALYRGSCAPAVRARLAAGERRLTCFWPDVRVRRVGPEELRRFGPPEVVFANLNTPADLERGADS
jgi:molybdopterin-guanine dinucleotide biosynthesis protein A